MGLGLASVSPWTGSGASANTIGLATIVWLFATQAISAGVGGYVAGRLRTKWAAVHSDEVYFRDTAHGFLVWAVGIVIGAAFLGSAASSIVGGTAKLAATTAGAAAVAAAPVASDAASALTSPASTPSTADGTTSAAPTPQGVFSSSGMYLTDELLRGDRPVDANAPGSASSRAELGRILAESMRKGALSDTDRGYAARVIAAQTGMSQADAEKRVDAVYAQAKSMLADAELAARTAADNARKALAKTSIWMFVALLFGAFCASLAATIGGRQRDGLAGVATTPPLHQREVAVGSH